MGYKLTEEVPPGTNDDWNITSLLPVSAGAVQPLAQKLTPLGLKLALFVADPCWSKLKEPPVDAISQTAKNVCELPVIVTLTDVVLTVLDNT